mgnify:CR=1 FL=1
MISGGGGSKTKEISMMNIGVYEQHKYNSTSNEKGRVGMVTSLKEIRFPPPTEFRPGSVWSGTKTNAEFCNNNNNNNNNEKLDRI